MYVLIAVIIATLLFILGVIGPFNKRTRTWVLNNIKETLIYDFYDGIQNYIDGKSYVDVKILLTAYLIYLIGVLVISSGIAAIWPLVILVLTIGSLSGLALKSIRNKNKQIKNKTK